MASSNAKTVKDFKRRIEAAKNRQDLKRACELLNEFAEWYHIEASDPTAARREYDNAAVLAKEIGYWHECAVAYRNLTDLALDKHQLEDAKRFVVEFAKAAGNSKNVAFSQQAAHTYALVYLRLATADEDSRRKYIKQALQSALKCKEYTERHRHAFASQDSSEAGGGYEKRMAALNQLIADIYFESGDQENGRKYSDAVKEFASLNRDYDLLFRTVWSEYLAQTGHRNLKLIHEAYDVYKKMKANGKVKPDLNERECLLHMAIQEVNYGSLKEAFNILWTLYKTRNSGAKGHRLADEDAEGKIVTLLTFVYKTEKRLARAQEASSAETKSRIAEAIADECADELFPFAVKQYTSMLQHCTTMSQKSTALESIAVAASDCHDYQTAYQRFRELLDHERRLGAAVDKTTDTELWMLRSMAHLSSVPYQDKKIALDDIAPRCRTNKQKRLLLEGYVAAMEKHGAHEEQLEEKQQQLDALDEDEEAEDQSEPRAPFEDEYSDKNEASILLELKAEMKVLEEQELVRKEVNKKINQAGETRLHLAAKQPRPGYGYDANQPDNGGWTPFSEAVSYGVVDNVKAFLSHGHIDLNVKSKEIQINEEELEATGAGVTPLMEACANGYIEIARLLIERGANLSARNDDDWSALDFLRQFNAEYPGRETAQGFMLELERMMRAKGISTSPGPPRQKRISTANKPSGRVRPRRGLEHLLDDTNVGDKDEGVRALRAFRQAVGPQAPTHVFVGDTTNDEREEATAEDIDFIAPEDDDAEEPILAPRSTRRSTALNFRDEDIMHQDDRNFEGLMASEAMDASRAETPPPKRPREYRSRSRSPSVVEVPSSSSARATRSSKRRAGGLDGFSDDVRIIDDIAVEDRATPSRNRRKRSVNGSVISIGNAFRGRRPSASSEFNDENSFAPSLAAATQNYRRGSSPSADSAFEGSEAQLYNDDRMTSVSDTIRRPLSRLELASSRSSHSGSKRSSSSASEYLPVIVDVEFVEEKWRLSIDKPLKLHWTRSRTIGDLKSECRERSKDACSEVVIEYQNKPQEDDAQRMVNFCAFGKENVRFTAVLRGWTCPSLKQFYQRCSECGTMLSRPIAEALDAADSTQRIDLSFMPSTMLSDAALVSTLAASCCRIPPIRKLNLQGTILPKSDDVLRRLAPTFAELHELDLTASGVDDVLVEKLLYCAENHIATKVPFPSLKQLSLAFNTFSAATCAKLLSTLPPALCVLDLSSVVLVESPSDDVDALIQSICGLQGITKLLMNACSFLTDARVDAVMKSCSQLKVIDLSRSQLTSLCFPSDLKLNSILLAGIPSLSLSSDALDGLAQCENLVQLDLSHTNCFPDWPLLERFLRQRLSLNAPANMQLKLLGTRAFDGLDDYAIAGNLATLFAATEPEEPSKATVHLQLPRALTERLLAIRPQLYDAIVDVRMGTHV